MDCVDQELRAVLFNAIPIQVDLNQRLVMLLDKISKGFGTCISNLVFAQVD